MGPADVLVGLGSNLGDRRGYLVFGLRQIASLRGVTLVACSRLYESPACGGPSGQSHFLNAVARLRIDSLEPEVMLRRLLAIEEQAGRVRTVRNGPRTLDLDILMWGSRRVDRSGLTIPHKRMHTRSFVLEPAADVAPDMVHPVLDSRLAVLAAATADVAIRVVEEEGWEHAVGHSQGV